MRRARAEGAGLAAAIGHDHFIEGGIGFRSRGCDLREGDAPEGGVFLERLRLNAPVRLGGFFVEAHGDVHPGGIEFIGKVQRGMIAMLFGLDGAVFDFAGV